MPSSRLRQHHGWAGCPRYADRPWRSFSLYILSIAGRILARQLTAIGNSQDGRPSGSEFAVDRRNFASFVLSGFLAAVAGVIYTMQGRGQHLEDRRGHWNSSAIARSGGWRHQPLWRKRQYSEGRDPRFVDVSMILRADCKQLGADPYSYRLVEGVVIFVAMYVDALKSDPRREMEAPGATMGSLMAERLMGGMNHQV